MQTLASSDVVLVADRIRHLLDEPRRSSRVFRNSRMFRKIGVVTMLVLSIVTTPSVMADPEMPNVDDGRLPSTGVHGPLLAAAYAAPRPVKSGARPQAMDACCADLNERGQDLRKRKDRNGARSARRTERFPSGGRWARAEPTDHASVPLSHHEPGGCTDHV